MPGKTRKLKAAAPVVDRSWLTLMLDRLTVPRVWPGSAGASGWPPRRTSPARVTLRALKVVNVGGAGDDDDVTERGRADRQASVVAPGGELDGPGVGLEGERDAERPVFGE